MDFLTKTSYMLYHAKYSNYGGQPDPLIDRLFALLMLILILIGAFKFGSLIWKVGRGEKDPDILFRPFRLISDLVLDFTKRIL